MKKRFLWLMISVWLTVGTVATASSSTDGEILFGTYYKQGQEVIISTAAWLLPGQERSFQTDLSTGFETAEGFTANANCAQNGWTKFVSSDDEGHIDTDSPAGGAQHVRISKDPSLSILTLTGCFSPDQGVQSALPSTASIDVAISDTGGADYDVVVQAPSEEVITARVKFFYNGDIKVVDEVGGDLEFVDTGVDWEVGPYRTLRINVNPSNNSIHYYYNGSLIYVGSIFAAATMEQIVIMSDNWQLGDHGDFDNVVMGNDANIQLFLPSILTPAVPPTTVPVLNPIDNSDGHYAYTVSWNQVNRATGYTLEESQDIDFANANVVFTGPVTSTTVSVSEVGTYYYRVRAENAYGISDWSNVVSTEVTQLPVEPLAGYWSGNDVSLEVSSDSTIVEWFELNDIYVPGCGYYTLRWENLPITNGQFSKGEFTTPTNASGVASYAFITCNGIAFGSASWSATWQHTQIMHKTQAEGYLIFMSEAEE